MKQISLFRVALALTTTFIGIGSAAGQTRADSTAWDKTALRQYIDEALEDEVKEQLENMPNIEGSDFRSERRVFQNDNQVQDAEFGRSNVRPAYVDYGNGGADQAS